jgi:hypothetical protein
MVICKFTFKKKFCTHMRMNFPRQIQYLVGRFQPKTGIIRMKVTCPFVFGYSTLTGGLRTEDATMTLFLVPFQKLTFVEEKGEEQPQGERTNGS